MPTTTRPERKARFINVFENYQVTHTNYLPDLDLSRIEITSIMPYWPDMSGLGTSMIPIFRLTDHPDLTMDGKRSRFALCASFSATLIISAYIPGLEDGDIAFLTNGVDEEWSGYCGAASDAE
ncbi:hypothetical protein DTO021C3_4400 [Paecilomyces variotii]|nr:hypothetical protein DTO021C3_4400 [Paecilomyces variotii]